MRIFETQECVERIDKNMYRVLHVMGCSDIRGISGVVLNFYRCIDREKVHFDIALKTESIGRNA